MTFLSTPETQQLIKISRQKEASENDESKERPIATPRAKYDKGHRPRSCWVSTPIGDVVTQGCGPSMLKPCGKQLLSMLGGVVRVNKSAPHVFFPLLCGERSKSDGYAKFITIDVSFFNAYVSKLILAYPGEIAESLSRMLKFSGAVNYPSWIERLLVGSALLLLPRKNTFLNLCQTTCSDTQQLS